MRGCAWRAGSAAIAISLCALPAGAVETSRVIQFAQNVSDAHRGATAPSQPPSASNASAALLANSPEQIRKAQTELRRLDCLKGRIDGKLGDQTRQAVKTFWTSAGRPAVDVTITDELIADLAERGDGFCRPARRFFAVGVRPSGTSALPPPFVRGARPAPLPAKPARPPAPTPAQ
jgi:peptidoglycan hydrolase-like protein with peptidoglycan-binding domain